MTASASGAAAGFGLAPSQARAIIRQHSKSFSLASTLLGPGLRDAAAGLYAYCRRADDAIDLVSPELAPERLRQLRAELDDVYAGRSLDEPVLVEFQRLVFERHIPRAYPEALLEGFQLDVAGETYPNLYALYHYCWCVAGSVGAMMCHVLGVRRERAVRHGAHLGMAMQLTNICRDVAEDWRRGRLYLPTDLTPGLEYVRASRELPTAYRGVCARAVTRLLSEAEVLYRSGDAGLPFLSLRSRLAVDTARRVYSRIGAKLLERDADVHGERVYVTGAEKLWHVAQAAATSLAYSFVTPRFRATSLSRPLRFPEDVLPF